MAFGLLAEYEMEQIVREAGKKAAAAGARARLLADLEEEKPAQPALKARIASALVRLAARLDAGAVRAAAETAA